MDLSALSNATTSITALSGLVVVSPERVKGYQPHPNPGDSYVGPPLPDPPALLFHYEGQNKLSLKSDITDHFVEDNTATQDQIALHPEVVTVHGFIGELNDVPPYGLQTIKQAADKLGAIGAYTPALSAAALVAYNEAFQLYQTGAGAINSISQTADFLTGGGGENVIGTSGLSGADFNPATEAVSNNQTKQQVALQQFYGYWRTRTLFTVQTPWAVLTNMAIQSIDAVQEEDTDTVTDFLVTFKMIRTAESAFSPSTIAQGRAAAQAAAADDAGTSAPSSDISMSQGMTNMGAPQ